MLHSRNVRIVSLFLALLMLCPVLSGCITKAEYDQARRDLLEKEGASLSGNPISASAMALSQAESPKPTRDIIGELAENLPPLPDSPFTTPSPEASATAPSPTAVPSTTPNAVSGPEDQISPSTSPQPSSSPSASPVPQQSPAEQSSEEATLASPSPQIGEENVPLPGAQEASNESRISLPVWDALYFGMSLEELKSNFRGVPVVTSGAMGMYLSYANISFFPNQDDSGEARFYYDEDDKLTLLNYEYQINKEATPLALADVEGQKTLWDETFGSHAVASYYDAWGTPSHQGSLYDVLADHGSALLIWYDDNLNILAKIDNGIDSENCVASFYFQPVQNPVLDLPTPQVNSSWTVESLLAYFARNELAAEYYTGKQYAQLTGEIHTIARDDLGRPYIALAVNESSVEVNAYFSEGDIQDLLPLAAGEMVCLKGYIMGIQRAEGRTVLSFDKCTVIDSASFDSQAAYLEKTSQTAAENIEPSNGE